MSKYINADIVERELKRRVAGNCLLCDRYEFCIDANMSRKGSHRNCWRPKNFPIVDAVKVVRCKDCVFRDSQACFASHKTDDMDFCSDGVDMAMEEEK